MGIRGDGKLNNLYWQQWMFDSWNNPQAYSLVKRYMHRPAEHLYHTADDPYEMVNLAESDSAATIKAELSAELDRWMKSQGDPGAEQDTHESHQAAKQGKHRFRAPSPTSTKP